MRVDFCVPVYNEGAIFDANAERIWRFLKAASLPYEWSLIFIVNGSCPDFEIQVESFANAVRPEVSCYIIPEPGKGRAIKTYFNASQADIIAYLDIDLAVDPSALPKLIEPITQEEADLVFGSRMLPESVKNRSWVRESSSRAYIAFSRAVLGHHFSDLQCGFKAIRASAWRHISPYIENEAWFFDTELIYYGQRLGYRLKEIPVDWSENRYSDRHSKVNLWRDGLHFIKETIALKSRS
ncbi:MAG: glycosyltransferase [Bacillota bacterium]